MFCPKCGKEVQEGAAFCGNCGNALSAPGGTQQANASQQVQAASGAPVTAAKKLPLAPIIVAIVAIVAVVAAVATGGFGLFGEKYVVEPKGSVDEYTWSELSSISDEIGKALDENAAVGIAKKYNLVGEDGVLDGSQRKSVTLSDGTQTSVQIAGFAHDSKMGGGKAGITFIFTDGIARHEMNSTDTNSGGWEASEMRSWLASEGKALLPQDLQDELVAVNKPTNNTGMIEDPSSVTDTSDELWLFSFVELRGPVSALTDVEGSQYKLFRDQNVQLDSSNAILVKTFNGGTFYWWARTPVYDIGDYSSKVFSYVAEDGMPRFANLASGSYAVVPGFCI